MWSLVLLVACREDPGATLPLPPTPRVVRLTHRQWENSVVDLLALHAPTGISDTFVGDPALGLFENDVRRLEVNPVLWQQYQSAAETLAEDLVSDPKRYALVVPQSGVEPSPAARDGWLRSFGGRVYRRPLLDAEVREWALLFDQGSAEYESGDPFADGVRATVTGMLQSPWFVYRIEAAMHQAPTGRVPLDGYETASKLSYALWSAAPDEPLTAAAALGLNRRALETEVERMLDDPRTTSGLDDFHRQLLQIDAYASDPSPSGAVLSSAMQDEVYDFLGEVWRGGGGVRALLTSRTTFVNFVLAPVYGVTVPLDLEPVAVELDPTQRSGLLTLSGFLASHAESGVPNLITRGAYVNQVFLCAELPPPPLEAVTPVPAGGSGTRREQVDAHTNTCGGGCHDTFINPIGAAFENYDADGAWRDLDNGLPIDASGSYPFTDGERSFHDGVALSELMAESEQVHRCYAQHLLSYYHGRSLGPEDEPELEWLTHRSLIEDRSIRGMLTDILTREDFRFRNW